MSNVTMNYKTGSNVFTTAGQGFSVTFYSADPDAAAYITAVETADGQTLEAGVKTAIDAFVVGCKADGIWDAIKASCIMAGARTLTGALVPLVGAAPTNFNFVAGDYNRKTGLVGNGSTKYLNSKRNNNADPQNSKHIAVWVSTHHTRNQNRADIGAAGATNGGSHLVTTPTTRVYRINWANTGTMIISDTATATGLWGASRTGASAVTGRYGGTNIALTGVSTTPADDEIKIFSRNSEYSDARLSFYSIGESLNLALLDARVTTLITAYGAIL
jgi:hypothetical protein